MPIEIVRELMRVGKTASRENIKTILENNIMVPDSKPDISKLLIVEGDIWPDSIDISEGRAVVNGTVNYRILYLSGDPETSVKGMRIPAGFTQYFETSDLSKDMNVAASCVIEHTSWELSDARTINIRSLVNISLRILGQGEVAISDHIRGLDDLQVMRESHSLNTFSGFERDSADISERLEIPYGKPPMDEVLMYNARISGKEVRFSDGKLSVKGTIEVLSLYNGGPEGKMNFMEHEIGFNRSIDMPGLSENANCSCSCNIAGIRLDPSEDADGELRVINTDLKLVTEAEAYDRKNLTAITDVYSPGTPVTVETSSNTVEELFCEKKDQIYLKNVLKASNNPDISEVVSLTCKPSLSGINVADGKVQVDGFAEVSLLYMTNMPDMPVAGYIEDIPFSHTVEIVGVENSMQCEAVLDAESCTYTLLPPSDIEARVTVGANIRAFRQVAVTDIDKVTETRVDIQQKPVPSIVICFCQPGDTLWKIAKRYRTTVDAIMKANDLENEASVNTGRQLIITGRK